MKNVSAIKGTILFEELLNETSTEEKAYLNKSLQIANQIIEFLERKGLRQKDFAAVMGKSEAEISRLLSGQHNFTIRTISNIECALNEKIILTPSQILNDDPKELHALISYINEASIQGPPLDIADVTSKVSKTKIIRLQNVNPPIVEVQQPKTDREQYLPIGA